MFKGKKFKIPQYPPNTEAAFKRLCKALSSDEIQELKAILTERLKELRTAALTNSKINLHLAESIGERCELLLNGYTERSRQEQALIVGAVSYFVIEEDAFSDEAFATGLHDDAGVMNHVLEELGIEDKFIDF